MLDISWFEMLRPEDIKDAKSEQLIQEDSCEFSRLTKEIEEIIAKDKGNSQNEK